MNKKGNAVFLITLLFVIIPLGLLIFWIAGHSAGLFSIASLSSCTDYQPMPGPIQCSSDAECVSKTIPAGQTIDPSVKLRCASSICEFKVSSCGEEVNE